MKKLAQSRIKSVKKFFSILGPGVVTGAADDDPSGVATYSIAGAQTGTSLLWLAWLTWPLMAAVQMMCARIGIVTGHGLADALKKKFPKPLLILFCFLLLVANIINIAADLTGMADAAKMLTGVGSHFFVILFGVGICLSIIKFHYGQIANSLKWLALALFTYVSVPFLLHPDWAKITHESFAMSLPKSKEGWETIVALLGTTISPYLFFWQASQEVEEKHNPDPKFRLSTSRPLPLQLKDRALDVGIGTLLSNVVMFFIILATALTLNVHGITNITTSAEAAEALRPLAGHLAAYLYTLGLVAVGIIAIPTLAGSAAYAFAETFQWKQGLNSTLGHARLFYGVIIFSMLCGILLDFLNINPMQALFLTAVINGLLAPFLMVGMLFVAVDKKIMKEAPSSKLNVFAVILATLLMISAAIGMFII